MTKKEFCNCPSIAYYSGFGGFEIKHIMYTCTPFPGPGRITKATTGSRSDIQPKVPLTSSCTAVASRWTNVSA